MSELTDKVQKLMEESHKNFNEMYRFKLFRTICGDLVTAGGIGMGIYSIAKGNMHLLTFAAGSLAFSAVGDIYALYRQNKAAGKIKRNTKEIETCIFSAYKETGTKLREVDEKLEKYIKNKGN